MDPVSTNPPYPDAPPPHQGVDPDRFGRLLTRIESDAHRYGWDKPKQLYLIYDAAVGDADPFYRYNLGELTRPPHGAAPVRCDGYVAMVCAPTVALNAGSSRPGGRGGHGLYRLSLNMTTEPINSNVAGLIKPLRHAGLRGLAFLHEGWRMTGAPDLYNPTVSLADRPGAAEDRSVLAVDIDTTAWLQVRVRGHKPAPLLSGPVVGLYDEQRGLPHTVEGTVSGDMFVIYTADGEVIEGLDPNVRLPEGVAAAFCGAVPEALNRMVSVIARRPMTPIVCEPHGWSWAEQKIPPGQLAALAERAPASPGPDAAGIFPPGFYAWMSGQLAAGGAAG